MQENKNNMKLLIPILSGVALVLVLAIILVGRSHRQHADGQEQPATQSASVESSSQSAGTDGTEASVTPAAGPGVRVGKATVTALVRPRLLDEITDDISAVTPSVTPYEIEPDLSNVTWNPNLINLEGRRGELLAKNGFFLAEGAGDEFYDIYEMNRYFQIPNFVTTDSMMHTYHLYFSHLMKNTERGYLTDLLATLSELMLRKSTEQLEVLTGSEWETAATRNVAFFGVGCRLLGIDAEIPAAAQSLVDAELALIEDAGGIADSPLLSTGTSAPVPEDYSQYIVRGYYEGDAQLEAYFRTMMWYGRINFAQKEVEADRSALLITMALDEQTLTSWEAIYMVTSFFAGASDDCGFYEYEPILVAAYGEDATAESLIGNEEAWELFHAGTAQMNPPLINSVVKTDEEPDDETKGFRFMGQRFSIDAAIFQNLIYDQVGADDSGNTRSLPDALDVPAALGSDAARSILAKRGADAFAGYAENMDKLRTDLEAADDTLWNASLYSKWLDTLRPILEEKGAGYPSFMQTDAWTRKNLQSFLGSYAELKHDTVLYSKQVMPEMGGGEEDNDDRGYVEPEPVVFARLAALTDATKEGLLRFGLLNETDASNLDLLSTLSSKLAAIAEKELRNELPTDEEFELIRSFGGQLEHFWQEVNKGEAATEHLSSKDFPAAVITDIATDPNGTVLEIGIGSVEELYAIVPVDGQLRVACGGCFSFYQFEHPASDRLTDSKWRQMMGIQMREDTTFAQEPAKEVEDWTEDFQYSWSDESW